MKTFTPLFCLPFFCLLTSLQAAEPITNSIGIKLVRIESGTFTMGQDGPQTDYKMSIHPGESDRADWDEKPVHKVVISKPFQIEPPPTPGLRREGSRGDEKGNS